MSAMIPTQLHTADDLIAYYKAAAGTLPNASIEAAIPAAIDAVYEARDAGASMHAVGAATAIAVLQALDALR